MGEPKTTTVVNGDSPQSITLRHLLTLPAVQDGVRTFSANPLGKMSIQLSHSAYQLVGAPMLSLFEKPLAYVTPYVQRVDELGDQTLSRVEARYPAVKKTSPELLREAKDAAYAPVRQLADVYNKQYESSAGSSFSPAIASGKAVVKTATVVSARGVVYALRGALKLGESFHITESLRAALDQVDEAVDRQSAAAGDQRQFNHDRTAEAEDQDGQEAKNAYA